MTLPRTDTSAPARVTARKHATGLASLADPALLATADEPKPVPVTPLNLRVANLLPVMRPLTGDPEAVAVATLLRAHCLGEVMSQMLEAWDKASPADREAGVVERKLLVRWGDWVKHLSVPTDAEWWLVHGRAGARGALHHARLHPAPRAEGGTPR